MLGDKIKIKLDNNKIYEGIFYNLNKDGSLLLKKDNELKSIYSGHML